MYKRNCSLNPILLWDMDGHTGCPHEGILTPKEY